MKLWILPLQHLLKLPKVVPSILKAWVSTPGETSPFDDTLNVELPVYVDAGIEPDVVEDFETVNFPRPNWRFGKLGQWSYLDSSQCNWH